MKELVSSILASKKFWYKVTAFIIIGLFFYTLDDLLPLFFISFIIGYLIFTFSDYLSKLIKKLTDKLVYNVAMKKYLNKLFSTNVIVTIFYILVIGLIIYGIYHILPRLIIELKELPNQFPFIKDSIKEYISKLEEFTKLNQSLESQINTLLNERNTTVLNKLLTTLRNIGTFIVYIFVGFILSYICIIERKPIVGYFERLKAGPFSNIYLETKSIFKKIFKWFGLIFRAQFVISICNTLLTILGLYLIGIINHGHFPYLLTLGTITFLLGFIPVAGMFISSIPIIVIGFIFGGIKIAFWCVALILIVHAVEAYFLNPRIIGSYAKIPMGISLIILIVAEHLLGVKGLIIGIPVFFIIMEIVADIGNGVQVENK